MNHLFKFAQRYHEQGLCGDGYNKLERIYKEKACEEARKRLPDDELVTSILQGESHRFFKAAIWCISRKNYGLNFIYPKFLHPGDIEAHIFLCKNVEPFMECVWEQMYGTFDERIFNRMKYILTMNGKPPIFQLLTIYAFLGNPQKHFMVQYEPVRHAAIVLGKEREIIKALRSKTWSGYQVIRGFAEEVKNRLRSPFVTMSRRDADLIDVQSLFYLANKGKNEAEAMALTVAAIKEFAYRRNIARIANI